MQWVARCLQMIFEVHHYRNVFVSIDGISTITTVLSGRVNCQVNFQIQYQLAFCLWIYTFNEKLSSKMNKYNVIPVLSDILSEAVKEKVTRMILATFRVNFHLFIISFFYWFFVLLIFCSNDDSIKPDFYWRFYNSFNEFWISFKYCSLFETYIYFHQLLTQYFSLFFYNSLICEIIRKNFFFSNNTLKKNFKNFLSLSKTFQLISHQILRFINEVFFPNIIKIQIIFKK